MTWGLLALLAVAGGVAGMEPMFRVEVYSDAACTVSVGNSSSGCTPWDSCCYYSALDMSLKVSFSSALDCSKNLAELTPSMYTIGCSGTPTRGSSLKQGACGRLGTRYIKWGMENVLPSDMCKIAKTAAEAVAGNARITTTMYNNADCSGSGQSDSPTNFADRVDASFCKDMSIHCRFGKCCPQMEDTQTCTVSYYQREYAVCKDNTVYYINQHYTNAQCSEKKESETSGKFLSRDTCLNVGNNTSAKMEFVPGEKWCGYLNTLQATKLVRAENTVSISQQALGTVKTDDMLKVTESTVAEVPVGWYITYINRQPVATKDQVTSLATDPVLVTASELGTETFGATYDQAQSLSNSVGGPSLSYLTLLLVSIVAVAFAM